MLLKSRVASLFGVLLLLISSLLWPPAAQQVHAAPAGVTPGALSQVTSFGNNPSGLKMYIYVPRNLAANPALLVAVHYCSGSASAFYNGYARDYVTAAEQYGYIIVFPESTHSQYSNCFDVWSPQALTRGGGSDPVGIMSMVSWTEANYNIDSSRIYVMGASSGAMMTNVLLAEYPDVFAAGTSFMGVPATCFATGSATNFWSSQCANGQISKTAQQWGDAARAMYPGYTGSYPRIQLWHGTVDSTLSYNNFAEAIKQWTNLHGISATPVFTDSPQASWTRTRYGGSSAQPALEAISVQGAGHTIPAAGMVAYSIAFLGLNSSGGGSPTVPPAPTGLTATAGNASVSLSWAASPGASSYTVKRATMSGGPYTDVATEITATSYTNTGLTNGTTYYYVVSASNSAGNSPNSAQASATPASSGTSTGNLVVQYKAGDTNATDNQSRPHFNIKNNGTAPVNLSGLKLRYYFTKDGTADMSAWIDWAQIGSSNIQIAFGSHNGTNSDTYVELSLSAGAGSIAAGGQSGEIQLRMAKSDWSNLNESNDYSYDPTKTAFADWNRVVLYQNGVPVWGVQP
ncbi:extracellular catalytic domain type 1 short-chain-length polyhydroxyalkanoate depolymerase [Paenibacillus woosongensis]|uniref:Esterase n=1 Tax=Paenibacillus woosongensis TaxID=307580 RepID=A0ABQ4MX41_9BACL|nr:PHB depolymerase family esterase [Paenibacillus woosongensis]GIP60497.1 hypothetical protein J15TS10_43110 [Paenibacillus woosongensis]